MVGPWKFLNKGVRLSVWILKLHSDNNVQDRVERMNQEKTATFQVIGNNSLSW